MVVSAHTRGKRNGSSWHIFSIISFIYAAAVGCSQAKWDFYTTGLPPPHRLLALALCPRNETPSGQSRSRSVVVVCGVVGGSGGGIEGGGRFALSAIAARCHSGSGSGFMYCAPSGNNVENIAGD